jgi:hypothetical protein
MGQAIGGLLPSAVGVALSPVPIIAVILMLDTPRARSNGPAFGAGWMAGLIIVSIIVVLAASGADKSDSGKSTAVDWITLILGVLFLAMAARQWQGRPKPGVQTPMPRWMQAIDQFSPVKSAGLGALLSGLNPKNLALTVAAASLAQVGLSAGGTTVAILVFVLIGSITVAGPVIFYLAVTDRAAGPLASIKQFMSDHNAVIMMIVLLVLGAKLIGNGIAGLTS